MQATFLRIGDSVGTRRISAVILRGQYFDGAGLEKIRAQVLIAPDIRIDEAASVNRPHPDLEIVEMPPLPAGDADSGTSLEGFMLPVTRRWIRSILHFSRMKSGINGGRTVCMPQEGRTAC